MLASWPVSAQKAAADMMKKYGPPQEVTPTMLKWHNNGPWNYTVISNYETPHSFPASHPDVMEQGINYKVPEGKFDDLAMYDGSVTADHDPSTPGRQGNDRGASYRSAIFYTSYGQRLVAENTIADVNASGIWPGNAITEVAPAGEFWEAEAEHQDYLKRIPGGYTCHFIRPGWKLPRRLEVAPAAELGS
jgi:hypothetical protein